ncbi:accessory gland protein Acp53Ea [Drosophila serrata]|uniref:accessory gland protein Acp53Ea n=1 Tax=Drosophila serrata TaxID=7274 RepID=UPI000A1D2C45|nr:accessory gland protein Acp53Ea [Drosophila serrata]
MKLLPLTLVLSLLACASISQAHGQDWDKLTKCARVGTTVAAEVLRNLIPELRTYLNCVDFNPPPNPSNCILGYIKVAYELLKRSVNGNINCLVDPLKRGIEFLKPNIAEVDDLKCLD